MTGAAVVAAVAIPVAPAVAAAPPATPVLQTGPPELLGPAVVAVSFLVLLLFGGRALLRARGDGADGDGADADDGADGPSPLSPARALVVLLGILAVGIGVVGRVAPGLLPAVFTADPPGSLPPVERAVIGAGGVIVLAALYTGFRRPSTRSGRLSADLGDPEGVTVRGSGAVGEDLERDLALLRRGSRSRERRRTVAERLREQVRSLAAATVEQRHGCSRAAAEDRVARGAWTDRRDVAAFLGGEAAPSMPLRHRLLDWLHADPAVVRRVDRAVAEIERQSVAERPVGAGGAADEGDGTEDASDAGGDAAESGTDDGGEDGG